MKNKGFTLPELLILIGIIFATSVGLKLVDDNIKAKGDTYCEHEYVTTSKYSFFAGKYIVISKCKKCGKEM